MFINEKKNAIELTKKETKAAAKFGTPEYKALQEAHKDYPGFKVVTVTTRTFSGRILCIDKRNCGCSKALKGSPSLPPH